MDEKLIIKLTEIGIMPILTFDDVETAVSTVAALIEGGVQCGEVTFRTAKAADAIRHIAKAFPDFLLGAGTIITVEQAQEALEAGARYLIAPGFSAELATFCQQENIPYFPGVMTPSEITQAMQMGITTLKLFPAGAAGGIKLLKAFAGPFYNVKFIPTGGVNPDNLADYLRLPNVLLCGGSWLAKKEVLARGDFTAVTQNAAAALATVRAVRAS